MKAKLHWAGAVPTHRHDTRRQAEPGKVHTGVSPPGQDVFLRRLREGKPRPRATHPLAAFTTLPRVLV